MLYLLKSFGPVGLVIYKIGYAEDVEKRISQYEASNPYIKVLSVSEGSLEDERLMHLWLHLPGTPGITGTVKDEWYQGTSDQDIVRLFEGGPDLVGLWNSREEYSERFWRMVWERAGRPSVSSLTPKDYRVIPELLGTLPSDRVLLEFTRIFVEPGRDFRERMKAYCDFRREHPELLTGILGSAIPKKYHEYYADLGESVISACSYQESQIKDRLENNRKMDHSFRDDVIARFKDIKKITLFMIKGILKDIYLDHGITKLAKATDLLEFFEVENTMLTVNGKRCKGYKIIKVKSAPLSS